MIRHLASILFSLAIGLGVVFGPGTALSAIPAHGAEAVAVDRVFPRGLPWAPTEDSCYVHRCVWDAKHQGNGAGKSLILTRRGGEYIAKRISHRRAHRLQAAWCERPRVACGYAD